MLEIVLTINIHIKVYIHHTCLMIIFLLKIFNLPNIKLDWPQFMLTNAVISSYATMVRDINP